jgi:hypothetical protein
VSSGLLLEEPPLLPRENENVFAAGECDSFLLIPDYHSNIFRQGQKYQARGKISMLPFYTLKFTIILLLHSYTPLLYGFMKFEMTFCFSG